MTQIHKKYTAEQIKVLFTSYEQGHISRSEIENTLGVGKTRFFSLLKQIREHPETFTIEYRRKSKARLSAETEEKIRVELQREKELIEDAFLWGNSIADETKANFCDKKCKRSYAEKNGDDSFPFLAPVGSFP